MYHCTMRGIRGTDYSVDLQSACQFIGSQYSVVVFAKTKSPHFRYFGVDSRFLNQIRGAVNRASTVKVAIDSLIGDDSFDFVESSETFFVHFNCATATVSLFKFAESHWQKAATPTAVSPTCAKANSIGFEDHYSAIGYESLQIIGSPQPAITATNYCNITLQIIV